MTNEHALKVALPVGRRVDAMLSRVAETSVDHRRDCLRPCRLCSRFFYLPPDRRRALFRDVAFCCPCRCNSHVHNGCIEPYVLKHRKCDVCGYKFSFYRYGTLRDFLVRYPFSVCLPTIAYCALALAVALIAHFDISSNFVDFADLNEEAFAVAAAAAFSALTVIFVAFFVYTFFTRFGRFQRRLGRVVVFSYHSSPIENSNVLEVAKVKGKLREKIQEMREKEKKGGAKSTAGAKGRRRSTEDTDSCFEPSGASSVYIQRYDNSIEAIWNFDKEKFLAASTPKCVNTSFTAAVKRPEPDRNVDGNANRTVPSESDV